VCAVFGQYHASYTLKTPFGRFWKPVGAL
jgi:hypothetical protein